MSNKSKKNARRRAKKKAKAAEKAVYDKEQLKRFPQLADEPERNVQMNGFRRGKVPEEVLENRMQAADTDEDDDLFDDIPTSFVTGDSQ